MGPAILTLLEDTRNQIGKHKNIASYCERNGIRIVRVAEIAQNCFQDHERFRAECKQAQDCGIRLIVLIEEVPPEGDLDNWVSPLDRNGEKRYLFDPSTLKKVMATMTERYGVQFRFCDGRSTGRLLIEYLKGERT